MCILVHVKIAALIRGARHAADLTQHEVAQRAHTAQPAVAAYESGARTPNLATLERLLRACDHDMEVLAHPRTRRDATSLAELAPVIASDLQEGHEQDAVRLLFRFADDFRGSPRPGKITLIQEEPPATGDPRFDAALAGIAELFAVEGEVPAPAWVNGATRFVEPWWFLASRPAFHAYTLAHTPAVLARHGVFIAREVFDRA
jgi:transcriptional regulator with XRE-family HTH domain